MSGEPKQIFVISPINKLNEHGVDFTRLVLDEIIKPAAEAVGGFATRADEVNKPGSIPARIFADIVNSDVCIADLTGRNPNVMYEVAIAHAAAKPVILLQQEPGGPPFDFAQDQVIHYGLQVDLANKAKGSLIEHLKAIDDADDSLALISPVRKIFNDLRTRSDATDPEKAILDRLAALGSAVEGLGRFVSPDTTARGLDASDALQLAEEAIAALSRTDLDLDTLPADLEYGIVAAAMILPGLVAQVASSAQKLIALLADPRTPTDTTRLRVLLNGFRQAMHQLKNVPPF